MSIDTGHGVTVTAAPGSYSGAAVSITLHTETIPTVDISDLATTGPREFMAGDLSDAGSVTIVYQQEHDAAALTLGTTATLTLTDATPSGDSSGGNWSGDAIITSVNYGERVTDQLKTIEVTFTWDGTTGPTWTVGT